MKEMHLDETDAHGTAARIRKEEAEVKKNLKVFPLFPAVLSAQLLLAEIPPGSPDGGAVGGQSARGG